MFLILAHVFPNTVYYSTTIERKKEKKKKTSKKDYPAIHVGRNSRKQAAGLRGWAVSLHPGLVQTDLSRYVIKNGNYDTRGGGGMVWKKEGKIHFARKNSAKKSRKIRSTRF